VATEARVGERTQPRAGSGILGSALASGALFAVLGFAPMLWPIAAVSPLPLAVHRVNRGLGSALLAMLLAAALVSWLLSAGLALAYLAVLAVPVLVMLEALFRGRGLRRGAAWAFLLLAVEIAAGLFVAGPSVAEAALRPFEAFRSPEFLAEMRTRLPQQNVDDWAQQATTFYNVMQVVYPGALFVLAALVVLANAALVRAYLARRDPGWLEGGEFEGLRLSLALPALFVAGGALVALPALRQVGYNVVLVTAFFFALQGLAVVAYYAHRLAGPPLLRAGLFILVLLNPWAPQILALLGLFDSWADFRRWADPPAAKSP
jgi:hypothetical protein